MIKEIKDYLLDIVNEKYEDGIGLKTKAKELLDEDFKNEVISLWDYDFTGYRSKEKRTELIEGNKIDFITNYKYSDEKSKFILKNWEKIDEIIKILQDYIKKLESENKDE